MVPRLYAPALSLDSTAVAVPPEEAEHLFRVLRLRPGANVRVFNGRGLERQARVTSLDRHAGLLEITGDALAAPERRVRTTLAQAILKGDKIDDVIRDAVMLGVSEVQPLLTARTDVPPSAFTHGGRVERWRRVAIASAKQCGRAVVPAVHPPVTLAVCLEADRSNLRLLLAEPSAGETGRLADLPPGALVRSAMVAIGPEGGWTADEAAAAREAGCRVVTLGGLTLRADAAPLVALSVLGFVFGEY
ncbi:MAG: RsmE family RNA methyltransferase [Acidobacteria bacterium]|nr:RsmE family RNA methyltransferase [Acidobacteriota bacterium]